MPVATFAVVGSFTADGSYVYNKPASASPIGGVSLSRSGVAGPASWGKVGTPILVSGKDQVYDTWGQELALGARSLVGEINRALVSAQDFVGVRVSDTTDVAMRMDLLDGATTPVALVQFFGASTGSRANNSINRLDKAASWSTTMPVYNLTLKMPDANQEVWNNIVGYKVTGGTPAYDAPTLIANITAAVNSGNLAQAKSRYFVAVPGTSTALPVLATNFTTVVLGTDGASGVTDAMCIGVDSPSVASRTGMYALRGSGIAQFTLASVTDPTTGPTQAVFAQSELSFAVGPAFPSGTDTPTAITAKQTNNINSIYQTPVMDWVSYRDPVTGTQELVSPLGAVLGIIAAQPPHVSPGNKPQSGLQGILGTERNGAPLGAEAGLRQQAGISYIGPLPRNPSLLGMPHGQNASGIPGQDTIAYTRLTNYLDRSIPIILGEFVDENQGETDPDPTRVLAKNKLDAWLQGLKDTGVIDDYKTVLDLSNNFPVTIEQGYMLVAIYVKYKSVVRFILSTLQAGNSIKISTATGPVAAVPV